MNPISLDDAIKNVYQIISQFRGTVGGQTLNAVEMIAVMQSHKIMVDELAKRQLTIDNLTADQIGKKELSKE
jgi:hypothetical protein